MEDLFCLEDKNSIETHKNESTYAIPTTLALEHDVTRIASLRGSRSWYRKSDFCRSVRVFLVLVT